MSVNRKKEAVALGASVAFLGVVGISLYSMGMPDCGAPDSTKMQNALADLAVDFEQTPMSSFNEFGVGTRADYWDSKDPAAIVPRAAVVTDSNTGEVCVYFARRP